MSEICLKDIIQAALLVSGEPLTIERLASLFDEGTRPDRESLVAALAEIETDCARGPMELQRIDRAYRLQTRAEYAPWLNRLFTERPPRYSRALLETLAIIAYRQPVTRGEIEAIRGVAVSSEIIKTLMQREWVRQIGIKEVPGRPALYGTSRSFLEYFNLTSLSELPPLTSLCIEAAESGAEGDGAPEPTHEREPDRAAEPAAEHGAVTAIGAAFEDIGRPDGQADEASAQSHE
ncbi:MAG: SMC-Scp complex subunit ScpB [Acidiferrobacter sp.]